MSRSSREPKPQVAPTKAIKEYSDTDIKELLSSDYLLIHPSLYDHVPIGSHIRYFTIGVEAPNKRFHRGGFVRGRKEENDVKYFVLSYSKYNNTGKFFVSYESLEQLWKKYATDAYIEIHMISASLAEKNTRIERLEALVKKLMENTLGATITNMT